MIFKLRQTFFIYNFKLSDEKITNDDEMQIAIVEHNGSCDASDACWITNETESDTQSTSHAHSFASAEEEISFCTNFP